MGDVVTAPEFGPDAAVTRVNLEGGRVYLAGRVVDDAARAGEPWAENADDEWDTDAAELVTVVRSGESPTHLLQASRQPLACAVSLSLGRRGEGDGTMTRYSTRDEAIEREIVAAIEAGGAATRDEYDIDAIAAEVLGDYGAGYAMTVEPDEFWTIVERHALTTSPDPDRIEDIRRYIVEHPRRSAWDRGVDLYALELLDSLTEQGETEYHGSPADHKALLNGADDWRQYSEGGCTLIYDADICERLCSPSEQKRRDGGRLEPNRDESWIDVQSRALYQAEQRIRSARAEVE